MPDIVERAYSLLDVKSIDEEKRIITGIATTVTPDRMDDIVESRGAQFKLPIPFLSQHSPDKPIGEVVKAKVTDKSIEVEVHIKKIEEPGLLKDRLDLAWQEIKYGLVKGLSIGFKPLEAARIEGSYGSRFIKWLWLELSAVTVAANGDCSIQTIKSIDNEIRAQANEAGADQSVETKTEPAATGNKVRVVKLSDPARDRAKPFVIREIKRV